MGAHRRGMTTAGQKRGRRGGASSTPTYSGGRRWPSGRPAALVGEDEFSDLSHLVLRPKLDALSLCVLGSSFTHKVTNSEINSKPVFNTMYLITKLITRPRGLNSGKGHLITGRLPGASTPRRSLHQRTPHLLSSRAQ
jgi:hypothetical protein